MRLGHGVRSVEDPALVGGVGRAPRPPGSLSVLQRPDRTLPPRRPPRWTGSSGPADFGGNQHRQPNLTDVTLTGEYERLRDAFGWGLPEFYLCNRNALDAAFLDDAVHARLMERLEAGYAPDSAAR